MPDYMQGIPIWFYVVVVIVGVAITLLACMPTKWVERFLKTLDRKFGRL
jgi:hypothetical protein